jgi:hypothetical protein
MKYSTSVYAGERVARRMVFLAWKACGGSIGMGVLQDRGEQDEDAVWRQAYGRWDYPGGRELRGLAEGEVEADYVFGRMMKLVLKFGPDWVETRNDDFPPRPDYQSWCRQYPTYKALFDAAVASLTTEGK